MKNVDQLLSSLRDHGTVDSEGEFTVSLSEARRKLKQYHGSEPGRYMLLLLAAGLSAGASSVSIERRGHSYRLMFAEATLVELEILQAMSNPQSVAPNSAASELVMGIQGAFAQGAQKVEVKVCSGRSGSFLWTLTPDRESSEHLPLQEHRGVEVRLYFDPSWVQRFRGFLASLTGFAGMSEEQRLIDRYADRALVPVTLDHQSVSRPIMVDVSPVTVVVGDIPSVRLGFTPDRMIASRKWKAALALGDGAVTLVVNGICYCQVEALGVSGIVYRDDLQRDVSKEKIVQNPTYYELLDELEVVRCGLLDTFSEKLVGMRKLEVAPFLTDLIHLFLVGRLKSDSRQNVWNWMVRQFPPEKCKGVKPSVVGLIMLTRMLCPERLPDVVKAILEDCAESLSGLRHDAHSLIQTTTKVLRALPGEQNRLLEGYLLLGSGALHALNSNQRQSDKDCFQALKLAWSCEGERAQELFHTHLAHPADHIAREAAGVLRMFGRSYTLDT